ncbi:MAG: malate dehydrogenase, partial [Myxococcales bacterium]|nr:malate dehydrogenase [Myxococcales bacterium]
NCLIAQRNAPDLDPSCFSALMRLDQNRAMTQIAQKLGKPVTDVKKMTIWGNHSATQYPDAFHAEVGGESAAKLIGDQEWIEKTFIPTVQQRGKAIIDARGKSSAASAASAAVDHIRNWALGTAKGDWVLMAVPSDGSYGIPKGLIYGFPVTCEGGKWSIVQGLEIDAFSRAKMDATAKELEGEMADVAELLG